MDDQTTELARDIFIAFSESRDDIKSDDEPEDSTEELQELKHEVKVLRSLLQKKAL